MKTENTLPENSAASLRVLLSLLGQHSAMRDAGNCNQIFFPTFYESLLSLLSAFLNCIDSYCVSQTSPFSIAYTAVLVNCKTAKEESK